MLDSLAREYHIVQAPRASAILYHMLVSQPQKQMWLLPANICPIVPITFLKAGVPFELVDISAANLHMDLEQAQALVKKRKVGGLLYAHTYGDASTPDDFFQSLKFINPELIIVDDRCLCIPAFEVSSSADVILYSTGYAKIVELGFGSYAFMKPDIDYQPVSLPFNPEHYPEVESAYKLALQNSVPYSYVDNDWLQTDAVLPAWDAYRGQVQDALGPSLAQRMSLNQIYTSHLPQEIQLPENYQTWRFNIRVSNKKQILKAIFEHGLFASSHYASLGGIMSVNRAPVAETLADSVINLFNDQYFDVQKAERVCEIILNSKI
jgi:hypothetical protein